VLPELISFEKCTMIIKKDPQYWPERYSETNNSSKKMNNLQLHFTFKEFLHAFDLMAIPENSNKKTPTNITEAKVNFFSKLHKAIESINIRAKSKGLKPMMKGKTPTTMELSSEKSVPEN
jgi:hypothetical protein